MSMADRLMKSSLKKVLFALLALLMLEAPALSQGAWEQLQKPAVEPLPYRSPNKTRQAMCEEAIKWNGHAKCRGFYIADDFRPQWKGIQRDVTHGLLVEILVRGTDAVLCYNTTYYLDDLSPCMPLYDANTLATRSENFR